jgi:hypothetical protein
MTSDAQAGGGALGTDGEHEKLEREVTDFAVLLWT